MRVQLIVKPDVINQACDFLGYQNFEALENINSSSNPQDLYWSFNSAEKVQ